MGYFNPFANIFPGAGQPMMPNQPQKQPINQQQFRQYAITLNDNTLNAFAQKAREQGISEKDIQEGIQFIKSM